MAPVLSPATQQAARGERVGRTCPGHVSAANRTTVTLPPTPGLLAGEGLGLPSHFVQSRFWGNSGTINDPLHLQLHPGIDPGQRVFIPGSPVIPGVRGLHPRVPGTQPEVRTYPGPES